MTDGNEVASNAPKSDALEDPPGPVTQGEATRVPAVLTALLVVGTFLGLILTSAAWAVDQFIAVLCALVPVATILGVFRSVGRDDSLLGWVGVAVAAALLAGVGAFSYGWLATDTSRIGLLAWLAVPLLAWLGTSLAVGARARQATGKLKEKLKESPLSIWTWFNEHRIIGGVIAVGYLSLVGICFEAIFFVRLGLPAFQYVDPRDVAFAILNHPILFLAVVVAALVVVLSFFLLRSAFDSVYGQSGQPNVPIAQSVAGFGRWFLERLPTKALTVVQSLVLCAAIVSLLLVPLGVAAHTASAAYDSLGHQHTGRLRLARPAIRADGVRHVASTAKHMIVVFEMCGRDRLEKPLDAAVWPSMVARSDEETRIWVETQDPDHVVRSGETASLKKHDEASGVWEYDVTGRVGFWETLRREGWRGVYLSRESAEPAPVFRVYESAESDAKLREEVKVTFPPVWGLWEALVAITSGNPAGGHWKPVVLPWSSVASFDMADPNIDPCFTGWDPGSVAQAGAQGPPGDSVDVQYSVGGGSDDALWTDKPTPDMRYIRFKTGGGAWEPPEGIRFVGVDAVTYAVSFESFRLSKGIREQMALRSYLPEFNRDCSVEVIGCASTERFFRRCARGSTRECGDCPRGGDCFVGMHTYNDAGDRLLAYHDAGHVVDALAPSCDDALADCVDRANGVLNCGVANLRAMHVVGVLAGSDGRAIDDLLMRHADYASEDGVPAEARFLRDACLDFGGILAKAWSSVTRDEGLFVHGNAKIIPATQNHFRCWTQSSALNRAVVMTLDADEEGGFGRCLTRASNVRKDALHRERPT